MRVVSGGNYLFKYNELSNPAKSQAIEESEQELFITAVNNLKTDKYLSSKKQMLEKKGFSDIKFYRFFIEDKIIRIDFIFKYFITMDTAYSFKNFAESINFKVPPIFTSWVKDGILEINIKSEKYSDIDKRNSNIILEKETVDNNYTIDNFIVEIEKTFSSYYDYILNSIYMKIRKDLKAMTNKEAFNRFIQENEYYSNGMLYEE